MVPLVPTATAQAAESPVRILRQPVEYTTLPHGGVLRLSVQAESVDGGALAYEWKYSTHADHSDPQSISGDKGRKSVLTTTWVKPGTFYFWVNISVAGQNPVASNDAVVQTTFEIVSDNNWAGPNYTFTHDSYYMNAVNRMGSYGQYYTEYSEWAGNQFFTKVFNGDFEEVDKAPRSNCFQYARRELTYWDTTHGLYSGGDCILSQTSGGTMYEDTTPVRFPKVIETGMARLFLGYGDSKVAEVSASVSASLYQEIATTSGDIYEWSVDQATNYHSNAPFNIMAVIQGSADDSDYADEKPWPYGVDANPGAVDSQTGTKAVYKDASPNNKTRFEEIIAQLAHQLGLNDTKSMATDGSDVVSSTPNGLFDEFAIEVNGSKEYTGATYQVSVAGKDYQVYLARVNRPATGAPQWVTHTGTYPVPRGQGRTVFALTDVFSANAQGNVIDNVTFASDAANPVVSQQVTYDGEPQISVATKDGFAYTLAEVRASTVRSLQEVDVWFTPTGINNEQQASPANVGDCSWYTPGAGTLTFKGLWPGKTYRLIGIPVGAITADANRSAIDVLDSGYYKDITANAARDEVAGGVVPNILTYYSPTDSTKGRVRLVASDSRSEYMLLTKVNDAWATVRANGSATSDAAEPGTWTAGTGALLDFGNLELNRQYRLISRPIGYSEVDWHTVAADESDMVLATTPAVGFIELGQVERSTVDGGDVVKLSRGNGGYVYYIYDPATGQQFWSGGVSPQGGSGDALSLGATVQLGSATLGSTLQIVVKVADSTFIQQTRVYPFAENAGKQLSIDYVAESVGVGNGVVAAGLQVRIDYNGQNLITATDTDDGYKTAAGSGRILLGAKTSYTSQPVLDSVTTGSATLTYRIGGEAAWAPYVTPASTLVIPARPDGDPEPKDVDWVQEKIGDKTFASYGYNGLQDLTVKLREPAVAGEKFASKVVNYLIRKRPLEPRNLVPDFSGEGLAVTGLNPNSSYQSSPDQVTWTPVVGISPDGKATLGVGSTFYVRFAPDPATHTPASFATKATDLPVGLENASIEPEVVGYSNTPSVALTASNKSGVQVTADAKVTLSGQLKDGLPYAGSAAFEVLGPDTVPMSFGPHESGKTGHWLKAGAGLPVGVYSATVTITYDVGGEVTSQAQVSFAVLKDTWPEPELSHTLSVTGNSITAEASGAPEGASVEYSLDQESWQASATFAGLEWATHYEVWARLAADENHDAGDPVLLVPRVFTDHPTPVFAKVLRVNYSAEVVEFRAGYIPDDYTLAVDGAEAGANASLTELADNDAGGTVSVTRQGVDDSTVGPRSSAPAVETLTGRAAAPSAGDITVTPAATASRPTGTISHAGNTAFEYRLQGSSAPWTSAKSGEATGLASGTYTLRYPATANTFASDELQGVQVAADHQEFQVIWDVTAAGEISGAQVTAEEWDAGMSGKIRDIQAGGMVTEGNRVRFTAQGDLIDGWYQFHWTDGENQVTGTDAGDADDPLADDVYDTATVDATVRVSVTVTAWFKRSVAYDANGGTGAVPNTGNTLDHPEYTVFLADGSGFSRDDYGLTGWNTKADGSGTAYELSSEFELTTGYDGSGADVTLYAQWASTKAQILKLFGEDLTTTGGDGSESSPYEADATVAVTQTTVKASDLVLSDGASVTLDKELAAGSFTVVPIAVTAAAGNVVYYEITIWRPAVVTELAGLIDTIEALQGHDVLKGYTPESVAALQAAINDAKVVLANASATQDQVDAAENSVAEALQDLVPLSTGPEVPPEEVQALQGLVNVAQTVDPSGYTPESYQALQQAIAAAQDALIDPGVENVSGSKAAMLAALAGLRHHYTTEVRVQVASVNVAKKKTFQLGAYGYLTSGKTEDVDYSSSDTAVATVSSTGKIKGVAVGTATITASSRTMGADGEPVKVEVAVTVVSKSRGVSKAYATVPEAMMPGDVAQVVPTWTKPEATPGTVTFSSSNKKIAVVDKAGKLQALAAGTVKIKVKAGSKSRSYTVKVAQLDKVTPKITGTLKVGETLTADPGTWGPGAVELQFQWYRDSKVIAGATGSFYELTKSDKGKKIKVKVTGAKAGYATASATSKSTGKVK